NLVTMVIAIFAITIVMITEELTRKEEFFVSFGGAMMVKIFGAVILSVMASYYYHTEIPTYLYFIFWPLVLWFVIYGLRYPAEENGADSGVGFFLFVLSFIFLAGTTRLFLEYPLTITGNIYAQLVIALSVLVYLGIKFNSIVDFSRTKSWFAFQIILVCMCVFFVNTSFIENNDKKVTTFKYVTYDYLQHDLLDIDQDSLETYIDPSTNESWEGGHNGVTYSLVGEQLTELIMKGKMRIKRTTQYRDSLMFSNELSKKEREIFVQERLKNCDNCKLINVN
ncbi:hypothetical protein KC866_04140, partial [Patescibacteria group bacterium]|nr:hypothetical protein [Patescibacteria group bacterium]